MKSRALAAFVRANPGIVGCVWFKYRNLELSLVGKWSRQEQEWSRGNEPRKSEGVSQAVVFVRTSRNAPCCWGGGGERCVTEQKRLRGRLVRKRLSSLSYSQAFPRSNLPLTDHVLLNV